MNCDRCKNPVADRDLVFTAFADEGGHFCKECLVILEPQIQKNFEKFKGQEVVTMELADGEAK